MSLTVGTLVVGLDASLTGTGIVVIRITEDEPLVIHRELIATTPDDGEDQFRVNTIVNRVLRVLQDSKCKPHNTVVALEGYAMGSRFGKSFTRSEITGVIKYMVSTVLCLPLYIITPTSLKKFTVHGLASKTDMIEACHRKFKFRDGNDNIVDAYCLTRYLIANRAGQRLALKRNGCFPAQKALQALANKEVAQVLARPLTKNLQPRIVAIAKRIPR